jgi:hypothetical protein
MVLGFVTGQNHGIGRNGTHRKLKLISQMNSLVEVGVMKLNVDRFIVIRTVAPNNSDIVPNLTR